MSTIQDVTPQIPLSAFPHAYDVIVVHGCALTVLSVLDASKSAGKAWIAGLGG